MGFLHVSPTILLNLSKAKFFGLMYNVRHLYTLGCLLMFSSYASCSIMFISAIAGILLKSARFLLFFSTILVILKNSAILIGSDYIGEN